MNLTMLILYVLLSFLNQDCFQAQPVTTDLSGTLSLNAMNNDQVITGQFDGSSNEMIVWANGEIVTRVTQFNESFGVLINNNGVAAGLGSNGISQDDRLIIANAFGEFDVVATITGSAGWSSLTAINEQGSVAGNYSAGSGSSDWQAFLWSTKSGLQFINPTAETTYAYDIDDKNRISGQMKIAGNYHAMLWENGNTVDLAKLLNLNGHSSGRSFDASGRILISEFVDSIATFKWYDPSNNALVDIHEFPFGSYTLRAVASDDGQVAFSWSSSTLGPQLARWSDENGFEYAILEKNILGITAISINQDGSVACTALTLPIYDSIAMVWSDGASPESLHGQLPDSPTTSRVITMNEDGELVIKGDANHWIFTETCFADLDTSGIRDVGDILLLLGAWGQTDQDSCGADIDGNGIVDVPDLLAVIGSWGPCE
ncbi:MAG: hypothetical protein HOJ00_03205 [Phycisphaerae bacterium]|jgi:hypothetical protein|nr:hypothetical protein [Phycisphaerae bacterium]